MVTELAAVAALLGGDTVLPARQSSFRFGLECAVFTRQGVEMANGANALRAVPSLGPSISFEWGQTLARAGWFRIYEQLRVGHYSNRFRADLRITNPVWSYSVQEYVGDAFLPYADLAIGAEGRVASSSRFSFRAGLMMRFMVTGDGAFVAELIPPNEDSSTFLYAYALNSNIQRRPRAFVDLGARYVLCDASWGLIGLQMSAQLPLGKDQVSYYLTLVGDNGEGYEQVGGGLPDLSFRTALTFNFKKQHCKPSDRSP